MDPQSVDKGPYERLETWREGHMKAETGVMWPRGEAAGQRLVAVATRRASWKRQGVESPLEPPSEGAFILDFWPQDGRESVPIVLSRSACNGSHGM